ncbi:MAG: hypothetical protein NVS3B26_02110 [Mycobacteriales bacterium]
MTAPGAATPAPSRPGLRAAATAGAAAGRSATRAAATGSARQVARAAGVTAGAARGAAQAIGAAAVTPDESLTAPKSAAGLSVKVPFASASVRLPGPGAVASVGPVRVTLPTGALYYGGLVALVVGGTLELPVAAGAALAGAVLGRRWLRGSRPKISLFDSQPAAATPAPRSDGPVVS